MISILYVDDEPELLEVAKLFLERSGEFRVGVSTSAQEALDTLPLRSYDAIVADYQMPVMDGIAFLKAIREQFGDLPFILFTGRGREEVVIAAINNGADFYLQKGGDPIAQFAELAHKIRQAVARRHAERSLKDSRRRLSDIINFLPDATFAIDKTGTVIAWNKAMEEMTGTGASEVLGKGEYIYGRAFYREARPMLIDLVLTPNEQVEKGMYSYTLRDTTTLTAETIRKKPDGTSAHFWGKACRLYDENGNLSGAIESIRDITELKKTEQELRRREEQYRSIVNDQAEMIMRFSRDGVVTFANEACRSFFIPMIRMEDVVGMNVREIIRKGDDRDDPGFLAPLTPDSPVREIEQGFPDKDGETHWQHWSIRALFDKDGQPVEYQTVGRDITEQKRAGESLKESETKYRELAELLPQMVFELDTDFRVTYANRHALTVMGFTAEDIERGLNALSFIDPSEHARVREKVQIQRDGIPYEPGEYTARKKDGSRFPVIIYSSPVFRDKKPAGYRGVIVDISARKTMEDALRQKNEELSAAFEQTAASEEELQQNYNELLKNEQVLRDSEEKFRALVENSLEGILITDFSGTLLFANRAAGHIVDTPDYEKLIGKTSVMEFVAPEYRPDVLRDCEKVLQGVDAYLVHYKLITREKREIWVECIGKKIPFEGADAMLVSMRDVTERKDAEEELKLSEKKFATVFRNNPVALTLAAAEDGKFVDVNETFLRNTGHTREGVIGRTSEELGLFPDKSEYAKMTTALREQHFVQNLELPCRIKSGGIRICRFSSSIIMMAGKPLILSTIVDITEQKHAEVALKESEGKFRRIADTAPDMIFRISLPGGKFEYVSPASVALTGYAPEEYYADPGLFVRIVHPVWQNYIRENWSAVLEGKIPPVYEYQIIDHDGKTRWFNQRNMLVCDELGKPVAIEGIITDFTRQKTTENELRRSELRSLAASENAGSWIWEVDPDGVYRYSSPAVGKILGYLPHELVGRMHFYDMFNPAEREELKAAALAAFKSHEPFRNFVNLNLHKNGTPVLLRTSASPVFDENGKFSGYCGIDEDITERTARESSFQALVRSMVGTTGINALRQIAENISSWLGTAGVMIGEIQPDKQIVNVTYMLLDGKEVDGFTYTLKGTPCENVSEKGFCLYQDNVRELFPEDRALAEFNIRGYIGTPLRDSAGTVFGILCALSHNPIIPAPAMQETLDIIAVKAAAEIESMQMDHALRESEQKFRSLVEYALEGIFVLGLEGTILFANDAAARTLECGSPAELIGRNVMEFVAPESQHDAIRDFGEVAGGHDAYLAQYRVITARGKTIFIDSIGKVINYEGKTADLVSIRDVTERKRAEDALNWSQYMLAEAMDMAHLVRWEFDVTSGMFTFDDRFYALYGTTTEREGGNLMPAEVYAREFVHPDDMHLVDEEVQRAISTNDPNYMSRIEHRIIRRDGEIRHMVVRIGLTKDAEGRTIKTHGANQDITEIRMAEEAVRESEVKYRLLAENVHDVIWTAGMDMRLTYISPSVMALRGFTVEEAMAESITDAVTPSSLEVLMRGRETGLQCLKRDEILPNSTMELEFYRKDGSTVWTETIISLAFDSNKKPVGVVGVIRDITLRRQVENALRESEERYRSLVETSPGMIWEVDPRGRFRYISPIVEKIMGFTPEEITGRSITDLVTEEVKPYVQEKLVNYMATDGTLPPIEVPTRHRSGREMFMEIRPSRMLDPGGKLVGFRGMANDITERKQAEDALTRANRQLTLLGSVTRHDLLNKITVILGYLKIVERKSTDPELADYLNKMRNATAAIKSQIEFTRVYQNLGTHEPQWINLETIMPYPYVPSKILIHADLRGIRVRADPMLEKVFFNLLDNSLRHGKQVTKIGVSSHPSGRDLVIVWEDNGVGIPADIKEQIFEHGFGENTGLGMFLAREILALTGITITETGEPGKGARFEIVVPGGAYRIISPP